MTRTQKSLPDIVRREITALLPTLEAVARGGPIASDLEDAPTLDRWSYVARGPVPALAGLAREHAILPDTAIVTSQVVWCDAEAGHARTRSRWYRLGPRSTIAPEVSCNGLVLPSLGGARAETLMVQAPTVLLAVARDLGEPDLEDRMAAIVAAWPPDVRHGRLR